MLKVVAVRDRMLDNSFDAPICVKALGQAIRLFGDQINDKQSHMSNHPEDYDLFHIAEYDEQTGLMIAVTPPKQIAIGKEMLIPLN